MSSTDGFLLGIGVTLVLPSVLIGTVLIYYWLKGFIKGGDKPPEGYIWQLSWDQLGQLCTTCEAHHISFEKYDGEETDTYILQECIIKVAGQLYTVSSTPFEYLTLVKEEKPHQLVAMAGGIGGVNIYGLKNIQVSSEEERESTTEGQEGP